MLDLVKAMLELVGKVFSPSEVSKWRQEKKNRELGVELFRLYIHLNEILITGESIVSSLETYLSRMEHHLLHANDPYALTAGNWIKHSIVRQMISISEIWYSLMVFSDELQVLDADAYRKIHPLIRHKVCALGSLLKVMDKGNFPMLRLTEAELLALEGADFRELKALSEQIEETSVPYDVAWDETTYRKVKEYLASSDPRHRLEAIRTVLVQMRETLENNFSVKDILVEVGRSR